MKEKLLFTFSEHYSIEDFKELKDFDIDIEFGVIKQKSVVGQVLLSFTLGAVFWFSKSFFSQLGKNAANGISQQASVILKKLSKNIFKKNIENPIVCLNLLSKNKPLIKIYFQPLTEEELITNFDNSKDVYNRVLGILSKQHKQIKEATITIKKDKLTDFFYITKNNDVYTLE